MPDSPLSASPVSTTSSVAIACYGGGLTLGDVLLLELPHIREEDREDVAWEFTGYPCFFAPPDHPITTFRRQLREFREGRVHDYP